VIEKFDGISPASLVLSATDFLRLKKLVEVPFQAFLELRECSTFRKATASQQVTSRTRPEFTLFHDTMAQNILLGPLF